MATEEMATEEMATEEMLGQVVILTRTGEEGYIEGISVIHPERDLTITGIKISFGGRRSRWYSPDALSFPTDQEGRPITQSDDLPF